jgi:hypothetical protein
MSLVVSFALVLLSHTYGSWWLTMCSGIHFLGANSMCCYRWVVWLFWCVPCCAFPFGKSPDHTLSLHRLTSNSTTNLPLLSRTENFNYLQDNSSARTPRKTRLLLLRMRFYSFVAWQQTSYCSVLLLGAANIENTVSPILLSRSSGGGVIIGCRIDTAVLLLPVFIAVRMFTDIPVLLRT